MNGLDYDALADLPPQQRWRDQVYPAPIVVALIKRQPGQGHTLEGEDHFVLIHRNQSPYEGKWALVGGKWDFGETLQDAIIREVKEETDLDAVFVAVRGLVSERVVIGQAEQRGAHFLIFVCELLANNGQAKEQEEGEVGWFTCAQIDVLNESKLIIPSDYAMIRRFAGAKDDVPYIEAEMRAPIKGESNDLVQLERFEWIEGHK
jgi:8-oxo-dGTP diphosphatase